jgi:putative molybdenum carrier protein
MAPRGSLTDGTVVFTIGKDASGGSLRTIEFARKHKKPCAHISRAGNYKPEEALQRFVQEQGIIRLNVAGSRESREPGIYLWVYDVIGNAFFWSQRHPGMLGGPGEGWRSIHGKMIWH